MILQNVYLLGSPRPTIQYYLLSHPSDLRTKARNLQPHKNLRPRPRLPEEGHQVRHLEGVLYLSDLHKLASIIWAAALNS